VAVIQIIVYAGAIMVLFLFVIMLLNAPHEDTDEDLARGEAALTRGGSRGVKVFGALLAGAFGVQIVWALVSMRWEAPEASPASSVAAIGRTLFTEYAFAFEVTSILILAAMVGAVVLAGRAGAGEGQP
jgi:NADH-quinone oxidoreductase subunit J